MKAEVNGWGIMSLKTGTLWRRIFGTPSDATRHAIEIVNDSHEKDVDWNYCKLRCGLLVVAVRLQSLEEPALWEEANVSS